MNETNDAVLIAIIVGAFGTVTSVISAVALYVSRDTHRLINSRMDELLAITRSEALAEGVATEKADQALRDEVPA